MKKILTYSAILFAALAAGACSLDRLQEQPVRLSDAANAIELAVQCADIPVVRATTPGVDDYNENTIQHIDYFIYSEDPAANTAATAVVQARIVYEEAIKPVDPASAATNAKRILLDNYAGSFTGTPKNGWVYVIANLPEEISGTPTYAQLQAIALDTPNTFVISDANNLEGRTRKDNLFVMASDPVAFSMTERVATQVTASLKRVAAKIQLEIHIAEEATEDLGNSNLRTWSSVPNKTQVYMLYAARHATVQGTPISYSADGTAHAGWFYNSPRYAIYSDGTANGTADGKVPDTLLSDPHTEVFPDYQLKEGVWQNVDVERSCIAVTSMPLYSYPLSWNSEDANAPFIKIILPWTYKESGVTRTRKFYYKLSLPKFIYEDGTEGYALKSNYCYKIKLNLSVLGSASDEVPVEVFGNYYIVDWDQNPAGMGGNLTAGRYIDIPKLEYEMYGNELEIPVRSSHALSVVDVTSAYPTYSTVTPGTGHLTRSATPANVTGNNFYVDAEGRTKIILKHTVETNLNNMQSRDVAPITYKFKIHQDGGLTSQEITVRQYPPIMIQAVRNTADDNNTTQHGYAWVNNGQGGEFSIQYGGSWLSPLSDSFYLGGNPRGLTNSANKNPNMYIITTSVLQPGSGYIIGDPRSSTIDNLPGPHDTDWSKPAASIQGETRGLSYYHPTLRDASGNDFLAPKLRIASSHGACNPMTQDDAFRRCASYQEDGLPAGRWRVPTKAEIFYMAQLTAKGLIPRLLGGSTGSGTTNYWCNNGYVTVWNGTSTHTPDYNAGTTDTDTWVRCVYNEWYWEGDTVDKTSFKWGDRP